jgi:hypothetical protein
MAITGALVSFWQWNFGSPQRVTIPNLIPENILRVEEVIS